jgi:alpha-D-ribose 1-methylphosphonate 5-triphosphate synthase subunit PhnH
VTAPPAIQEIGSRGLSAAETQRCFRAALTAMAHPGRIVPLGVAPAGPPGLAPASLAPSTWAPSTWALCLTLLDRETPVWLDAAARCTEMAEALRFYRGTPSVADIAAAQFAVILDPERMPPLDAFAPGTDEAPENSATLIIELRELGQRAGWRLGGPGIAPGIAPSIASGACLSARSLPADFMAQWRRNHGLFPRGVDILFACDGDIAALPRTTRIEA